MVKAQRNIVSQVVENEKKLRERILNDAVKDKIMRSYGILKNCFIISFEEFCSLWSNVLLGIDLGIIETIDRKSFKNLIVKVAPATLNCEIPHERDRMRAETNLASARKRAAGASKRWKKVKGSSSAKKVTKGAKPPKSK